jgi:group I intron endonuclease
MYKSGLYIILNLVNYKFYLGSAKDLQGRFRTHKSLLNQNKHHSIYLQRAWNKYEKENFEFVVLSYTTIDLLIKEQQYLDEFKPKYNISISAHAPMTGRKHSKETKLKFIKHGSNNSMFNKSHTPESKEKISVNRQAAKMTDETRKIWINKLSKHPGYWKDKNIPKKTIDKMKTTLRKKFPKISCSNGKIYNSQLEASKDLNIKQGHISEHIQGLRSTVKGFTFKKIKV